MAFHLVVATVSIFAILGGVKIMLLAEDEENHYSRKDCLIFGGTVSVLAIISTVINLAAT